MIDSPPLRFMKQRMGKRHYYMLRLYVPILSLWTFGYREKMAFS